MKKKMIIDRIPNQFYEGPFWGNGKIGTVLYVRDGKLCISMDHVKLWEMRETLPDEPKAAFHKILQHKEAYLRGDPNYVEDTNIFEHHIGRTRLPALAVEIGFPGDITDFCAETDFERAETILNLTLNEGRKVRCSIRLDSCVNILYLEWGMEEDNGERLSVKALGWDLESSELAPLKRWKYQSCVQTKSRDSFTVVQHYGGHMSAVMCGRQVKKDDCLAFAVGIDADEAEQEEHLIERGTALVKDYLQEAERYQEAHEKDWAKFWSCSDITVPNERIQESYWQEMYKLYCNEREFSMPVTLQGVWNPNNRMPAWFGDLHNDLNVQSCYWPAYKTGHVNLVRPYIDYYAAAIPRFEERARKLFGIRKAIHLPTMMAPDGRGAASEWCYWNTLLGPELFAAVDFTWFYEYSRELDTLREKIYPFIEGVLRLYQGIAYEKEDGYLHIPFTTSPEVDRDGHMLLADDAAFTISSLHYLCQKMAGYAKQLDKDGSGYLDWDRRLTPIPVGETGFMVFDGIPVFHSHRHFCQLYPIFPLCQEAHNKLANQSLDTVINQGFLEYAAFSFPYIGIFAARCGRGNMCRTMLEMYCMVFRSRNSFTVNGDPYRNGVLRISHTNAGESSDAFTLESGFFVPTLLCEMFVHRCGEDVWMLMGIPDEWKDCSCRNLVIEGGHKFSITMERYRIKSVRIIACCEEKLTLHWRGDVPVRKVMHDGREIAFAQSLNSINLREGEIWSLTF